MRQEEATAMLRGGKEGVTRWNELRLAGDEIPDLSGADLSQSDLIEADLNGADLVGPDLIEAEPSD